MASSLRILLDSLNHSSISASNLIQSSSAVLVGSSGASRGISHPACICSESSSGTSSICGGCHWVGASNLGMFCPSVLATCSHSMQNRFSTSLSSGVNAFMITPPNGPTLSLRTACTGVDGLGNSLSSFSDAAVIAAPSPLLKTSHIFPFHPRNKMESFW